MYQETPIPGAEDVRDRGLHVMRIGSVIAQQFAAMQPPRGNVRLLP
jgi:hypothetical protein